MDILATGGALVIVSIAVVAAIILIVFLLIMVRAWYKVAKADQALVVVGKSQKNASGESSRISVITGSLRTRGTNGGRRMVSSARITAR